MEQLCLKSISYLKNPGPLASESISSMDDVSMLCETCKHVLHALLKCVHLKLKVLIRNKEQEENTS
jgi:hypothetical protein